MKVGVQLQSAEQHIDRARRFRKQPVQVTTGAAETTALRAFADDILNIDFVPIRDSLAETACTLDPGMMSGSEVLTLVNAEFASPSADFTGYLTDRPRNLSTLLSDLSGGLC